VLDFMWFDTETLLWPLAGPFPPYQGPVLSDLTNPWAWLQELGVTYVADSRSLSFAAAVRSATGGRGVDVVVEHTGTATWDHSLKSLVRGGRLVTCGATTGHDARIDLRFLFGRQLSLLGSYMGRKGELLRAAPFFFAGELRSVVDRTYPLAEAAEAHRRLEARAQFGKIVLVV